MLVDSAITADLRYAAARLRKHFMEASPVADSTVADSTVAAFTGVADSTAADTVKGRSHFL